MTEYFEKSILKATGAYSLYKAEVIQELWSGYGQIIRYGLTGSKFASVVVKYIKTDFKSGHPRGWDTDISHNRKIESYKVEINWYKNLANKCNSICKIPKFLGFDNNHGESLIILEDLNTVGFNKRLTSVSIENMKSCLSWLAKFHSVYLGTDSTGLWKKGTYWHLETRPDELKRLEDERLKNSASQIDRVLDSCNYKTLVHGDAKLANFCFSENLKDVAMVDFQYVGGGCGIKDVAYFIGSCLYDEDCERYEEILLYHYFNELKKSLENRGMGIHIDDLITEWRYLYSYAWADFHRFLKGWSPGHWKINSYSERMCREVLDDLEKR